MKVNPHTVTAARRVLTGLRVRLARQGLRVRLARLVRRVIQSTALQT
jgi:hypothetical protein